MIQGVPTLNGKIYRTFFVHLSATVFSAVVFVLEFQIFINVHRTCFLSMKGKIECTHVQFVIR